MKRVATIALLVYPNGILSFSSVACALSCSWFAGPVVETHAHRAGFQVAAADDEHRLDRNRSALGIFALNGVALKSGRRMIDAPRLHGFPNSSKWACQVALVKASTSRGNTSMYCARRLLV